MTEVMQRLRLHVRPADAQHLQFIHRLDGCAAPPHV
jgi:hypothetical protein